jgi:hypothetical protein
VGEFQIKQAGECLVKVRARDPKAWKAMNLVVIRLQPVR